MRREEEAEEDSWAVMMTTARNFCLFWRNITFNYNIAVYIEEQAEEAPTSAATNVSMYFFSGQSSSLVTDGDRPRFNGMSGLLHG